jgi:hypothetical protein
MNPKKHIHGHRPKWIRQSARVPRGIHTSGPARDDPRRILELYALLFCQGGFRQIGLTFARPLLVVAAVKPGNL